jgi:hypothetical protein
VLTIARTTAAGLGLGAAVILEGINDVTPGVLPGWDIAVATEALPEPIEGAHREVITERAALVTARKTAKS